ncbi:MAG: type III secretion system inner membrane ring subunit SctD [Simkaniaceae bacterium]|nr:type III secretion system inner membrane ring subunit SctD [Candidatus Sacchlamyda saccharinae]
MKGYLIAEEGPLAGLTVSFEDGEDDREWSLGRDPETSDIVLEDPMVSRKHALVSVTPEGFLFENLSSVNPATQNGMVIAEPVLLKEGDIIQIGSTFFNFTEKTPEVEQAPPEREEVLPAEEGGAMASELHFGPSPDTRWLLKVISGPNAGAEFAMRKGSNYLIGKDPNICDIVFQDLSVSRQHARLSIDEEENAFVEDLGSRNGVIVNGELISEKQLLSSQDLVALGTTTFLVVDRMEARETIISPPAYLPTPPKKEEEKVSAKERRDWKELIIPKRHLAIAGVFGAILLVSIFSMVSLFKSEPVMVAKVDESEKIEEMLKRFPGVQFSFNQPSGKLFLTGNVLTTVDHQEMLYLIKEMPFVANLDDNVIVDELVWQSMNDLLSRNPDWIGVSMYGPTPGRFVLRGYVDTVVEAEELSDYLNLNFDYLDKLENQVVVEKNMETEIAAMLVEKGFSAVAFELSNGEIVLSGRIDEKEKHPFNGLLGEFKNIPGIRTIKNYVVVTSGDTSRVDLSKDFSVTGYSKRDNKDLFVVINGRILGIGDLLDGMLITKIDPRMIFLEKEGVKYRINYNLQ